MSEYQRYEFMTIDKPLTREQLNAVNALSSHINASSTRAVIEYHWGDFKHDPINVLYQFFDGFLYWANWGSPQLAFRFPHGALPTEIIDIINGYDFDDFVTFTKRPSYDILDIHFNEMEAPDEWVDYELGSLIAIRDELMEGDLRPLYIVWLAAQRLIGDYDEEDEDEEDYDEEDEGEGEDEDEHFIGMPVPPGFGSLTAAQQALAELLQVPQELLAAVACHSGTAAPSPKMDIAAAVERLSQERRSEYLRRLALNEPGLSRLLVKELRELSGGTKSATPATGEHIPFATLLAESEAVQAQQERERREQELAARQQHLRTIHEHQEAYWRQVDQSVSRGNASGYDDATRVLLDLRGAAEQFKETQEFQKRFSTWVRSHLRRPAFIKRLQNNKFSVPEA